MIEEDPPKKYTKSAGTAAKKISDKYKKIRKKRNIDAVKEIKNVASKKNTQITATKISDKYKKMRYKKPPPTFLVDEADVETIDYNNDSDEDMFTKESVLITANKTFDRYKKKQADDDMYSKKCVVTAANKIFDRYKKEQAQNNLDEAEAINYVDDTNLTDITENKNTRIPANKITKIYKRLSRKRKRKSDPKTVTVEGFKKPSKKRKGTTKSAIITARNVAKKHKKLRYR